MANFSMKLYTFLNCYMCEGDDSVRRAIWVFVSFLFSDFRCNYFFNRLHKHANAGTERKKGSVVKSHDVVSWKKYFRIDYYNLTLSYMITSCQVAL